MEESTTKKSSDRHVFILVLISSVLLFIWVIYVLVANGPAQNESDVHQRMMLEVDKRIAAATNSNRLKLAEAEKYMDDFKASGFSKSMAKKKVLDCLEINGVPGIYTESGTSPFETVKVFCNIGENVGQAHLLIGR